MSNTKTPRPESIAGRLPKRVVIVGCNESAWMAAACLGRQFMKLGCRISVVASGTPKAEFPGESTLPSFLGLLSNLHIDEHDMMRATHGTYQVATQFSDWVQTERDFWIPFAPAEQTSSVSLFDAWFAERSAGRLLRPFHSYSLHWGAALAGKSPYGFSGPSSISQSGSYAFHLDGRDLAVWLRGIALAAGVEEIQGEIATVAPNGRGGIAQIRLTTGIAVASDFFIDCTGSEAILRSAASGDTHESWSDRLLCDRMIIVRLPGRRQIPPFTRITGLAAGWSWQIPLATKIDVGYFFGSQFATDDAAWQQLRESLTLDGVMIDDGLVPECLPIRSGRLTSFWHDNVLALGTAACRMDPLASAGRHLSQLGIETFIEMFPERTAHRSTMDYYNERMRLAVEEICDYTQLHYILSKRTDSSFWQSAVQSPMSQQITRRLALYDAAGTVGPLAPEAIGQTTCRYLLAGCGRFPGQPTAHARSADPTMIQQSLRAILKNNESALKDLPLHEELLDWIQMEQVGSQKSA